MNKRIVQEVKKLPNKPGIYIYHDTEGRVIYVGKAINLKNRVRSYFNGNKQDVKTKQLVSNIDSLEHIVCGSEIEALLLESEFIKRYKPKYNIDWKDDKNYVYIRITDDDYPKVMVVRQLVDTKSKYFGPFIDAKAVRETLKILRRIFPYCTCGLPADKVCLYYHLGLCNGHGEKYISKKDYQATINDLGDFLKGKKEKVVEKLKKDMKTFSKAKQFEKAAVVRDKLSAIGRVRATRVLEDKRDLKLDLALTKLKNELNLPDLPLRIECYDISNIYGKFAVGSMVVFEDGVPKRSDYRRFEIKSVKQINDFAMLQEVLHRRFKNINSAKDKSFSKIPNLIVIDGGKGQLSSVEKALEGLELKLNIVGLAKKLEEVFFLKPNGQFGRVILADNSEAKFLLQRVRDEAHRFAITYHRNLRSKELTQSLLDKIEGIGPAKKRKLIQKFGTIENIKAAETDDIAPVVGRNLAEKIKREL